MGDFGFTTELVNNRVNQLNLLVDYAITGCVRMPLVVYLRKFQSPFRRPLSGISGLALGIPGASCEFDFPEGNPARQGLLVVEIE